MLELTRIARLTFRTLGASRLQEAEHVLHRLELHIKQYRSHFQELTDQPHKAGIHDGYRPRRLASGAAGKPLPFMCGSSGMSFCRATKS